MNNKYEVIAKIIICFIIIFAIVFLEKSKDNESN